MTSIGRLLVGLSIFSLVLIGGAWGQTGPREGAGGGPSGLYDPQTVTTVSGVIVSLTPPQAEAGLPYLAYLTLRTETGKIKVFWAQSLYRQVAGEDQRAGQNSGNRLQGHVGR